MNAIDQGYGVREIDFYRRPDEIRARKAFEKGELVLVPVVPLSNIVSNKPSSCHVPLGAYKVTGAGSVSFYAVPPQKPREGAADDKLAELLITGFFWVADTFDETLANMKIVNIKENGITVPTLQNSKKIEANRKLYKFKVEQEKEDLRALSNVISVVSNTLKPSKSNKANKA